MGRGTPGVEGTRGRGSTHPSVSPHPTPHHTPQEEHPARSQAKAKNSDAGTPPAPAAPGPLRTRGEEDGEHAGEDEGGAAQVGRQRHVVQRLVEPAGQAARAHRLGTLVPARGHKQEDRGEQAKGVEHAGEDRDSRGAADHVGNQEELRGRGRSGRYGAEMSTTAATRLCAADRRARRRWRQLRARASQCLQLRGAASVRAR